MLARQLRHHPAWTPGGLAADLAVARDRLALMRAENLSVSAAFGLSYADLTAAQQRLFRRLGLHPGPDIDAYAAAALDGAGLDAARHGLEGLYDQHLLAEPAPGRYQLHDLLREHARALAAAGDPAESDEAAGRLLDYYLHTALIAGRYFTPWTGAYCRPPPARPPAQSPDVSAIGPASAWLEAERANLHAAVDYAAGHGRSLYATAIPAAVSGFLAARGHWDQSAALQQSALIAARRDGDRLGEADTLAGLGVLQQETGDYPAATASLARALALYGEAGDPFGQADALNSLGVVQQETGDYPAATASQQRALALYRDLGDLLGQAWTLDDLGLVQQGTGDYLAAAASHQRALDVFRDLGNRLGQAEALNRLGELATRTSATGEARERHDQALAIARDIGLAPEEARALEGLGQAYLRGANPGQAVTYLREALAIYQRIGAPAARRVQQALQDHQLA
jgi:tetratricopeptide (TPR) repeat protein